MTIPIGNKHSARALEMMNMSFEFARANKYTWFLKLVQEEENGLNFAWS